MADLEFEEEWLSANEDVNSDCPHIAIVSISETECQCMDCLRKWPKEPGFKSDWPQFDRWSDANTNTHAALCAGPAAPRCAPRETNVAADTEAMLAEITPGVLDAIAEAGVNACGAYCTEEMFAEILRLARRGLDAERMFAHVTADATPARLVDEFADLVGSKAELMAELQMQKQRAERMAGALDDMRAGWRYIRKNYGDLYGVGWNQAERAADTALAAWRGEG